MINLISIPAILLKRSPIAVADLRAALAALTPVNSLTRESLELLSSLFAKRNDDEVRSLTIDLLLMYAMLLLTGYS